MRWKSLIPLLVLVLTAWGCDVHEYPEGDLYVDVTLNVTFDKDLPLYRTLDYRTKAEPKYHRLRSTVKVYHATGPARWSDSPDYETTVLTDDLEDFTLNLKLEPMNYRIMVWSDYVDENGRSLYYDPEDFNAIKITEDEYSGSNQFRDAFSGVHYVELASTMEADASYEGTVEMTRPVGKYSVVATDRLSFLRMFMARVAQRGPGTPSPITPDAKLEDIDISIFKVVVSYSGFLPDTYNMWNARPVDARTGVQFNSSLSELENGDLELAFDYVIVNGEESSVDVSIYVFDDLGDILSTVRTSIPLHRGMRTVLTGNFLTSGAASGVSIRPGYDGEFNIPL